MAVASATCSSSRGTNTSDESTVVTLINQWRQQNGLGPLSATPALTKAAVSKSADMASTGVFGHDDIFSTMQRFNACGNSGTNLAENIAAGNTDPSATFTQWKSSSEHNANMLSAAYHAMGVGHAVSSSGYSYWTTEFDAVVDAGSATGGAAAGSPSLPTFQIGPSFAPAGPGGTLPNGQGCFGCGSGFAPTGPAGALPSGQGCFGCGANPGFVPAGGGSAPTSLTIGAGFFPGIP